MCDHCKTYKPLLEGSAPYDLHTRLHQVTPNYTRDRPAIAEQPRTSATDRGCCSWRQTCCDGGCCSRVRNCCSTEPETQSQPYEKAPPVSYGYGYGSAGMMGLLPMTMGPMPDRVPCKRQEQKLPMCFGGDCNDSSEDLNGKDDTKYENDVSESTPRQSER